MLNRIPDRKLSEIRPPTDEGFTKVWKELHIKRQNKLTDGEKNQLKSNLNIIAAMAERMRLDQKALFPRRKDHTRFRMIAIQLRNAAQWIDRYETLFSKSWQIVEPSGLGQLSSIASRELSNVLSPEFVSSIRGHRREIGSKNSKSIRDLPIDLAIASNPGAVLWHVFLILAKIFVETANTTKYAQKDGPKASRVRRMLLLNLALEYRRLGGKLAKSRNGPFYRFVHSALEAMGVDTNFVDSLILEVVNDCQKLTDNLMKNT